MKKTHALIKNYLLAFWLYETHPSNLYTCIKINRNNKNWIYADDIEGWERQSSLTSIEEELLILPIACIKEKNKYQDLPLSWFSFKWRQHKFTILRLYFTWRQYGLAKSKDYLETNEFHSNQIIPILSLSQLN